MITRDESCFIVSPPEELTIKNIQHVYDELSSLATEEEYEGILLNLIGVVEIDTAGFQLIISFKKEVVSCNKSFTIVGMSSEVAEIIALYNTSTFFEN